MTFEKLLAEDILSKCDNEEDFKSKINDSEGNVAVEELESYIGEELHLFYNTVWRYAAGYVTECFICTEDFVSENMSMCDDCGEIDWNDDMYYVVNGGYNVCQHCYDNGYFTCEECGEVFSNDRAVYVELRYGSEYICEECFDALDIITCEHCENNYFSDSGMIRQDDDGCWYCEDCVDNGYGYFSDDDYYDDDESNICGYHYHKYNMKNEFIDNNISRYNSPKMGFELEVSSTTGGSRRDASSRVDEVLNSSYDYVVFEQDGSIGNGFEIISYPASLETHLGRMSDFEDVFYDLVHAGFTSHDNEKCGLHIHIDKKYFGDIKSKQELAAAKLVYIFEKHWENLLRFSRRTRNQTSSWCKRVCDSYHESEKTPAKYVKSGTTDRYRAINITNDNTFEIRLWRGTIRPESFEATLRFTDRLARIAKKNTVNEICKMTFDDILGDDPVIRSYWETVKNRSI